MVRLFGTALATLVLVLGIAATPASGSHLTIWVYSPYTSSNWFFTQGEHGARLASARDLAWPSMPSSITFNATSGVVATVATVADNCGSSYPHDKYVTLSLSMSGQSYGQVSYVHITNPSVGVGQQISPGTSLGAPQTQSSPCWFGGHSHMERSSNGSWSSGFICGFPCAPGNQFAYSSPVLSMLHSGIERPSERPKD